jgi:hypothetical protein
VQDAESFERERNPQMNRRVCLLWLASAGLLMTGHSANGQLLGIKASQEALQKFNNMKLSKGTAFLIFVIQGNQIVVEKAVTKQQGKDDYLDGFITAVKSSGQPRFAVVDWNHKLVFVSWLPDTAKATEKTRYASAKESFAQELVGVTIKLQATDDGELSKQVIVAKTKSPI